MFCSDSASHLGSDGLGECEPYLQPTLPQETGQFIVFCETLQDFFFRNDDVKDSNPFQMSGVLVPSLYCLWKSFVETILFSFKFM